jgi:F420-dependent oxidoreductase-like protein
MKLGLHIASSDWQGDLGPKLKDIVTTAESVGFDTIDVDDHLSQHPILGGPEANQIEAYTALGFIAAHTSRVRLMTLTTAASYRPAALLAKMVTTLDVLSGGRMMLSLGVGDYEEEATALGLPYPSLGERFDLLEETVQVCLEMWEGKQGSEQSFHGKHVSLERPLNLPQSSQRPHPPILITGGGEKRSLPLVARYADACNIPPSPEIPHKLERLRQLCEEAGRDYEKIEKTAPFGFDVSDEAKIEQLLEQLRWLAGMGIETVYGWVVNVDQITPLEVMGRDVIPQVASL